MTINSVPGTKVQDGQKMSPNSVKFDLFGGVWAFEATKINGEIKFPKIEYRGSRGFTKPSDHVLKKAKERAEKLLFLNTHPNQGGVKML